MAASSILAITLVPVLMTVFSRARASNGKPPTHFALPEMDLRADHPLVLRFRKTALFINFLLIPLSIVLVLRIGSEFMPPLYEGTIFYMPVSSPGISVTEAGRLLSMQDKIRKAFPRSKRFSAGRQAETATDPAPSA